MKNLVIVESPGKVKTIEKFLGKDYKVMSSFGHIRDLEKRGMSVDITGNFTPRYEIPADKKNLVRELKAAAKEADTVWLASDEDREGEAISWHLYEVLDLKPENTHRIVFHEITEDAIKNAIKNPRDIDIDMVNAQQARRVLDRIVGFELSPVLWKKIKPSLSAGRVQSVALRLVCDREKEIDAFTPEPFFRINGKFGIPGGSAELEGECSRRFAGESEAREFLSLCDGARFAVGEVVKKPVTRKPSPPFTTSTLQQEAGRKLGFSVNTTMRVAQSLYESGHITYMRTDSTNLSKLALDTIAAEIKGTYGDAYLHTRKYHTSSKGAQEAHEAIRPTYVKNKTISGTPQERKLYDLIWKRAVASQMSDARLERTNIDIDVTPKGDVSPLAESFKATGEVLVFEGYMKVYGKDHGAGSTEDTMTHAELEIVNNAEAISKGRDLSMVEITATERFTQAPGRYSESALVRKMEELGIGRPSTYAPTISTLQHRDYIVHGDNEGKERQYDIFRLSADGNITSETAKERYGSNRGRLVPTDIGMVVNDYLTEHFPDIMDYGFTARVEEKFDEIAEGKLPWQKELEEFYGGFHPYIERAETQRTEHKVGERTLGEHPETGRRVSVKIGRFGPLVQIGDAGDDEKPLFASLLEGQSIQTITLEEALKLFELPRILGEYEGEQLSAAIGRFGPYIKHGKSYVSIPKEMTPQAISLDEAIALIEAKKKEDAERLIKTFPELPGVEVLNGKYGPYIAYKKEGAKRAVNYKIPKGQDAHELSAEDVKKLMEAQDASPKKGRRKS